MEDNQIDEAVVLAIGEAIKKAYVTYGEFATALDELQYALFYLQSDEISREKQRDFAFLIQVLKDGIRKNDT